MIFMDFIPDIRLYFKQRQWKEIQLLKMKSVFEMSRHVIYRHDLYIVYCNRKLLPKLDALWKISGGSVVK